MGLLPALRTAAATLLVAAAVVLLPQGAATAAACGGASGITVVVDPNQLGGGISAGCDGDGGGVAAENFRDAGYTIEYSQAAGMGGGFVCKVSGRPADGDCTQANAYWSLWWSDGKSGRWIYASRGATSLKVPTGGYVAFAWHQGGGNAAPPGVAPTPRVSPSTPPAPKPSAKPTAGGGAIKGSGSGKPAKPSATPTASTSASPSASSSASPSASDSASASPTTTPSDPASATSGAPVPTDPGTGDVPSIDEITDGPPSDSDRASGDDTDGGGFPVWLGAVLAVVVLGGAAAVPILRRRG